nr:fermentation/respiration switch protein [Salmonella sp. NCTC 7297]
MIDLYDTVIGYRGGNWIYEWATQAMDWQQKACQEQDAMRSGRYWLHASTLYNIAAYPHLKGDELAEQAQALANRAYEEAAQRLPGSLREMEFAVPGGSPVTAFLHMPKGDGPFQRCSCAAAWTPCKPTITPCMNAISRRAVSQC